MGDDQTGHFSHDACSSGFGRKTLIIEEFEKAICDLDVVFASTSRIRKVNKKIISILDLEKKIKKKQNKRKKSKKKYAYKRRKKTRKK